MDFRIGRTRHTARPAGNRAANPRRQFRSAIRVSTTISLVKGHFSRNNELNNKVTTRSQPSGYTARDVEVASTTNSSAASVSLVFSVGAEIYMLSLNFDVDDAGCLKLPTSQIALASASGISCFQYFVDGHSTSLEDSHSRAFLSDIQKLSSWVIIVVTLSSKLLKPLRMGGWLTLIASLFLDC